MAVNEFLAAFEAEIGIARPTGRTSTRCSISPGSRRTRQSASPRRWPAGWAARADCPPTSCSPRPAASRRRPTLRRPRAHGPFRSTRRSPTAVLLADAHRWSPPSPRSLRRRRDRPRTHRQRLARRRGSRRAPPAFAPQVQEVRVEVHLDRVPLRRDVALARAPVWAGDRRLHRARREGSWQRAEQVVGDPPGLALGERHDRAERLQEARRRRGSAFVGANSGGTARSGCRARVEDASSKNGKLIR